MIDKVKFKEALAKDLADPNGYWNTLKRKDLVVERWVDKISNFIKEQTDESLEILFDKVIEHNRIVEERYYAKYQLGQSDMFYILVTVFDKIGEPYTPENAMFVVQCYKYKNYVIDLAFGQGSHTSLYKI